MNKKAKTPVHEMIAGDVYHPGEFIADELAARGMKQVELATALDISKSEMSLLIHGKRNISVLLAVKLEEVFGMSAESWMNLQIRYEIERVKQRIRKELSTSPISKKRKSNLQQVIGAHT